MPGDGHTWMRPARAPMILLYEPRHAREGLIGLFDEVGGVLDRRLLAFQRLHQRGVALGVVVVKHARVHRADAKRLVRLDGVLGERVYAAEIRIVDAGGDAAADRLQAVELGGNLRVLARILREAGVEHVEQPIVEVPVLRKAAAQQIMGAVRVAVDQARQNRHPCRIDDAFRFPFLGNDGSRANVGDALAANGNRAPFDDTPILVDSDHGAVLDQDRGGFLRHGALLRGFVGVRETSLRSERYPLCE